MVLHQLSPFTLDTRTMLLMRDDEILRIPMKTVEVLSALLERRGAIVTKDELLKAVWPDSIVEEANLTVHVALLRKTLGAAAPIETIPKRGYRLLAESPSHTSPEERRCREAVFRGRYFWNKFTRTSLDRASAVFLEARSSDTLTGEAHSGLCDTGLMQGLFGFDHDRSVFTRAREHGERAVAEAPESADAQASLAFSRLFDQYDFEGAGEALTRARKLAPARVEPHLWSALFHALRGDALRAMAAAREATAIDPVSLKAIVGSGFHLYLSQQHEPEIDPLLRALELEPDFAVAHWALGLAYDRLGEWDKAETAHRSAVLHSGGSPTMESNLARSLALSGRRRDAEGLRDRLVQEGLAFYRKAAIDVALGENETGIRAIERAFEARDPWLVVMKVDPMFEPIRKDRRVRAIEKEVVRG